MENSISKIQYFTDLKCWQKGHELVLEIYRISKKFPKTEQFGLTSQLQRAAVSVTSNIAEGFSRSTYKDKSKFYSISLGSLTEVQNQLIVARDLGYVGIDEFNALFELSVHIKKILAALIKKSNAINNFMAKSAF